MKTASSAYRVLLQNSRTFGNSFIKIINSNGAKIEPWATPTDNADGSDWAFPQQVTWLLLNKKEFNQFCPASFKQKLESLRSRKE